MPILKKAAQLEAQTLLRQLAQADPGQEWFRRKRRLHAPGLGAPPLSLASGVSPLASCGD